MSPISERVSALAEMPSGTGMAFRLGLCAFGPETRELFRGGRSVALSPKAFRLLEALIEKSPKRASTRFAKSFAIASPLLLLFVASGCRRPGTKTPPPAAAARLSVESEDPPRAARPRTRPGVILVGLDGADWSLIDRLASSGRMPNFERIEREGRTARLTSFVPILSPIVWTSIATGVTPDLHGVLDFQEIDPATGATVPISGRSRRVPAVWNVASALGLRVGVAGWWATDPAEQVDGFFVSDHASSILFDAPTGSLAFPPALSDGVRSVMASEGRIPEADLAPYVQMSTAELSAQRDKGGSLANPVAALAKILGATRTVQRVARDLYDRQRPDFTAIYFEGTDSIGHVFAADVPPKLACTSDEDFRRYSGTVDAYYALVDRLVGQWMRRAQEDGSVLLVCSDHGFKWGEDRTCRRSSLDWATAAFWHRLDGVLAAWGPRVSPPAERGHASVYDVAPTVSALLGLPVDREMSGKPLLSWFSGLAAPRRENIFAAVPVRRLAAAAPSPYERDEYAKKLQALGYLSGSESRSGAVSNAGPWPGRTEGAWNNLGLFEREAGRYDEAERAFRESLRLRPGYPSPMFNLAVTERLRGRMAPARDWLFRAVDAGRSDPEQTLLQFSAAVGKGREAMAVLEEGTHRYPASEPLAVALGRLRFEEKDCRGAVAALARFGDGGGKDALNLLGVSELCAGDRDSARRHFEKSLAIDPAQSSVHEALRLLSAGR
jgi:Type I phosphodiesterase / nucleotide pyrophosphatase/Tetratricopeptide repeat